MKFDTLGKRGGAITVFAIFAVFYLVWFAGLGSALQTTIHNGVVESGTTGFLALFLDNFSLFVTLLSLIGLLGAVAYFGGG